jgi:glycosyltransferase involved in cell wall biosynthesis
MPAFAFAPLITAVLIVRNEASTIARALQSVKPCVARIIVVDTGSTDNTAQIATRLGAEVYFLQWQSDFALARNYALDLVRTVWALSLDADEEILLDDWRTAEHSIQQSLHDARCGGINVILHNILQSGDTASIHRYTRLFRALPSIRYAGAIHEQIRPAIETNNFLITECSAVIKHYGYAEYNLEKITRNRTLLESALTRDDSAWNRYHLAMTEFSAQNVARAEALFRSIIDHDTLSQEQREFIRLRLAQITLGTSKYDECLLYTAFESEDIHREGFRRYIRATAHLQKKEIAEMLLLLEHSGIESSVLVDQRNIAVMRSLAEQIRTFI